MTTEAILTLQRGDETREETIKFSMGAMRKMLGWMRQGWELVDVESSNKEIMKLMKEVIKQHSKGSTDYPSPLPVMKRVVVDDTKGRAKKVEEKVEKAYNKIRKKLGGEHDG